MRSIAANFVMKVQQRGNDESGHLKASDTRLDRKPDIVDDGANHWRLSSEPMLALLKMKEQQIMKEHQKVQGNTGYNFLGQRFVHKNDCTAEVVEKINKSFKSKYNFGREEENSQVKPKSTFKEDFALLMQSKHQKKRIKTATNTTFLTSPLNVIEGDIGHLEDTGSKFKHLFSKIDTKVYKDNQSNPPIIELNSDGSSDKVHNDSHQASFSPEPHQRNLNDCPQNTPAQKIPITSESHSVKADDNLQAATCLGKRTNKEASNEIQDSHPVKIMSYDDDKQLHDAGNTTKHDLLGKVAELELKIANYKFKAMTCYEIKTQGSVNSIQFEDSLGSDHISFSLSCQNDKTGNVYSERTNDPYCQASTNTLMRAPLKSITESRTASFGYFPADDSSQPAAHRFFEDLKEVAILDFDISRINGRWVYTAIVSQTAGQTNVMASRYSNASLLPVNSKVIRMSVDDKGDRCMTRSKSKPKTVIRDRQYQHATNSMITSIDCDVMARSKMMAVDRATWHAYYVSMADDGSRGHEQILKVDLKEDSKEESGRYFIENCVVADTRFLENCQIQQIVPPQNNVLYFISKDSLMSYNEKTKKSNKHFLSDVLFQLTYFEDHLYVAQKSLAPKSHTYGEETMQIHVFQASDMIWKHRMKIDPAACLANPIAFRLFTEHNISYITFISLGLITTNHAQSYLSILRLNNNSATMVSEYQLGEVRAAKYSLALEQFPQIYGLEIRQRKDMDTQIAIFGVSKILIFSRA